MTARIAMVLGLGLWALGSPSAASAQAVSPQTEQQLGSLAAMMAPGQAPASPTFGGFMAWRRPYTYFVELQAGVCYTLLGVGGPGVVDLDLFLFDPTGRRVAVDLETNATPRIYYCATFAGPYRIDVKVKRGAGEAAVRAYRPGGGPAPRQPMPPPQHVAPPEDNENDEAYPPPPQMPPPQMPPPPARPVGAVAPRPMVGAQPLDPNDVLGQSVEVMAGRQLGGAYRVGPMLAGMAMGDDGHADWQVELEMGRCYNFIGGGGPGVRELSIYLWYPTGKRATQVRGNQPVATLTFCAPMPGLYRVQGKVGEGRGEFRVGVYTK